MESADIEIIGRAKTWLGKHQPVHLVTVVKTWGSSPRPVGSLLAVSGSGDPVGSVSGGCVEDDLIGKIVAGQVAAEKPELVKYGITREEGEKFGLPCGGVLKLVVEPLSDLQQIDRLLEVLQRRELITRTLDLESGRSTLSPATDKTYCTFDEKTLVRLFGPAWQIILVGAGDLSRCVAELLMALNYHVVICDPRREYTDNWQLDGTEISTLMPDDLIRERVLDHHTGVITLTHDPRIDDLALMEALTSPAFYVAGLGSVKTQSSRRKRLLELGLAQDQVNRLYGPAGLPIGSHTPMEIAIAIGAEIIALRNNALPLTRAQPTALAAAG